jgi:hypothetical protein
MRNGNQQALRDACRCFPVGAKGGYPAPPEQLWVAAQDLEHALYPRFLAATEWPAYPWRTVAKHLKRITRTRQKDGRRGLGWGQHGPSPIEYMIRGPRKRKHA